MPSFEERTRRKASGPWRLERSLQPTAGLEGLVRTSERPPRGRSHGRGGLGGDWHYALRMRLRVVDQVVGILMGCALTRFRHRQRGGVGETV